MKLIGAALPRATTQFDACPAARLQQVLGQAYEQTVDHSTVRRHIRPLSWPSLPTFTRKWQQRCFRRWGSIRPKSRAPCQSLGDWQTCSRPDHGT